MTIENDLTFSSSNIMGFAVLPLIIYITITGRVRGSPRLCTGMVALTWKPKPPPPFGQDGRG
jgi:hypothetical protein